MANSLGFIHWEDRWCLSLALLIPHLLRIRPLPQLDFQARAHLIVILRELDFQARAHLIVILRDLHHNHLALKLIETIDPPERSNFQCLYDASLGTYSSVQSSREQLSSIQDNRQREDVSAVICLLLIRAKTRIAWDCFETLVPQIQYDGNKVPICKALIAANTPKAWDYFKTLASQIQQDWPKTSICKALIAANTPEAWDCCMTLVLQIQNNLFQKKICEALIAANTPEARDYFKTLASQIQDDSLKV
ncbi:MAG: hypothetical protein FJZ58_06605, partial [Chlamydiae bacterium]|nr:hypothetical protein [Chlamydiota bacterium]